MKHLFYKLSRSGGWLLIFLGLISGGLAILKISWSAMAYTYDFSHPAEIIGNLGVGQELQYLSDPADVRVDSDGNFFILNNNIVSKYDIGTTTWMVLGTYGTGVGQFNGPQGMSLDSTGNIYVADTNNHRIQKYDIGTTSWTAMGTGGTGIGEFKYPKGISLDSTGNIYVADTYNHRIQKYDIGTTSWTTLGVGGTGVGQFIFPEGILLDSTGNIYVADTNNGRIQKYDIGTTTWTVVKGGVYPLGNFNGPKGLFLDKTEENLYISDHGDHQIKKYNIGTTTYTVLGTYGTGVGQFYNPQGMSLDSTGNIYVADTNNHRIQKYDIGTTTWTIEMESGGTGPGWFKYPDGVTSDSTGNIYVADTNNHRIQKYDIGTTTWTVLGTYGTGVGQFDRPGGIISDSTGNIYVTDIGNSLVQKYNIGTKNWTVLGPAGHEIGQFAGPYGLSLDSTGDIYVADEYNHRIQKYDIGTTSWSVIGVGLSAALLKVDSTGNIYTGFGSNIYKYDIGTTSYTVIGTAGTGVGQFDIPGGMAVDSEDNLYVTDPYNHRIQKYDVGTTSWTIYSCSDGDGVCGDQPDGIDIDSIGNLYITDISTNRIQKLIYYPEPTPTPSITITPTDSISPSPSVSPSPTPLSYILTYSRQPNGSIFGESPQTVFFGGSGTEVLAVGDSGYTFLQWSDGSLDNPRIDVGVTGDISVSAEFTLARSFSSGVGLTMSNEVSEGNISIGGSVLTDTFNFTFNRAYIFDDILAEVAVPAGTVVTRSDSGSLNLNTFGVSNVTSQVSTEKAGVLGALKLGIPDYGLTFSKNISLMIPVNDSFDGQVLKVWYRSEGSTTWNEETTCLVVDGKCAFQTNHATTFAVIQDVVVNNNNSNNVSSNNNQSSAGPPGPPVCTDSTPLFAPDLFQINASKNSAKLYFTPLNDTNGRYYISFSAVNSNAEEHGEMVTLLKEGVQSHTIYKLKPNTTYYVKVRGQNGCMPGKWSTVMKFKTGSNLKIFYKYTVVKKVIKSIFGR